MQIPLEYKWIVSIPDLGGKSSSATQPKPSNIPETLHWKGRVLITGPEKSCPPNLLAAFLVAGVPAYCTPSQ